MSQKAGILIEIRSMRFLNTATTNCPLVTWQFLLKKKMPRDLHVFC